MKILIDIDERLFVDAANYAAQQELRPARDYQSGGAAYHVVARQVAAHIKAQDYSEQIAAAVARLLPDVLADTVRASLETHVKRTLKTMKESGELARQIEAIP